MFSKGRDLGAELPISLIALAPVAVTAGGTGDNTQALGVSIDRSAYTQSESIAFVVAVQGNVSNGHNIVLNIKIQESADGTVWADLDPKLAKTSQKLALLTRSGAGAIASTQVVNLPLEYCRRFARVVVTPDMSNAATDTCQVFALALFGGVSRQTAI